MHPNLFQYEEYIRLAIGVIIGGYGVQTSNWILIPISLMLIFTSKLNFCPVYKLLGINRQKLLSNEILSILPKHNPEPVFIFNSHGELIFRNHSAEQILPSLKSLDDLQDQNEKTGFANITQSSITGFQESGKSYLVHYKQIPKYNAVVAYGFNVTKLIEANDEIVNTQKELLYRMGEIGETRSKETGNHVKRVAEYSRLLAELVGLEPDQCNLIKLASPMHDIGKVAIPDYVLLKPGKLDEDEWTIMKTHAEIGYELLRHSDRPILQAAAIVAGQHHEKWNGKGYPNGLSGENIHIFGRITALADVYDALASDRVYKKAWPLEEVIALIKREKGEHFDPKLVDLFLKKQEDFNQIRLKYVD